MRITNAMMTNRLLTNTNRAMRQLDESYLQMTSLKKIQMPSDNPIIANRSLKYRSILAENERHTNNVDQVMSWKKMTDTSIGTINDSLISLKGLCVSANTDSITNDDRVKIAENFKGYVEAIEDAMLTEHNGRYIFSGFKTDIKPIIKDADGNNILNPEVYGQIDDQYIQVEIGKDNYMDMNTLAHELYTPEMYEGLHSLDDIIDRILSGEVVSNDEFRDAFSEMQEKIAEYSSSISKVHTKVGVNINRLELIEDRLAEDNLNYEALQSKNEDVNLADAVTRYHLKDTAYSAALQVGMMITRVTLVDFL